MYHTDGECLWIVPLKCASTSIRYAARLRGISRKAALAMGECFTVGVVRHPKGRVEASLSTVLKTMDHPQKVWRRSLKDPHIAPIAPLFDGFDVDFWLNWESLEADWRRLQELLPLDDLPHLNRNPGRRRRVNFDEFRHLYERDLALCK